MASSVDIANLALSHFGQAANLSSIVAPFSSAEAEHAGRFYPIALAECLESHPWTWATKRAALAELVNDRDDWAYRYAIPADCLKPRRLLPDGYADTENDGSPYEWEGASIYCDEALATLVYTFSVTDTTKFSPMFVKALGFRLSSYMAGPILKDPTGRAQAALYARSERELGAAAVSNANATRKRATHTSTAKVAR